MLLVMLLVTKPVSSLNVTFSDENKSSLKGKWWPLVLLFATNLTSTLKAYNSDEIISSLKMRYIYNTSAPFFSHQTFITSHSLKLSLTTQPANANADIDRARQRRPKLPPATPTQTPTIDIKPSSFLRFCVCHDDSDADDASATWWRFNSRLWRFSSPMMLQLLIVMIQTSVMLQLSIVTLQLAGDTSTPDHNTLVCDASVCDASSFAPSGDALVRDASRFFFFFSFWVIFFFLIFVSKCLMLIFLLDVNFFFPFCFLFFVFCFFFFFFTCLRFVLCGRTICLSLNRDRSHFIHIVLDEGYAIVVCELEWWLWLWNGDCYSILVTLMVPFLG